MRLSTAHGAFLKQYCPTHEDQLRYCAGIGYRYIDFDLYDQIETFMGDDWRVRVDSIRRVTEELGLRLNQAHSPEGFARGFLSEADAMERIERSIEVCGMLGIPRTVVHSLFYRRAVTVDEFIQRNVVFYNKIMCVAERHGVEILVENLGQPRQIHFLYLMNGYELLEMIEAVGHPLIHACWDTGHANHNMADQSGSIRALGKHLKALHIHDNTGDYDLQGVLPQQGRPNMDAHNLPFFGNINWDGVMSALLSIGYEGTFNLEVDNPRCDQKAPFYDASGQEQRKLWKLPLNLREEVDRLQCNIA
ncbi:MAG: sugar phosphate isomerase/epimerase, partial [Oscillospiraceae bacterium]|nr:sugar phosphate isomerase/epimerase [Oscillospiraceae bacterium]